MFEAIKNRDAWSAIRGYVYQVDVTIQRWLNLEENEILELEKGEDIDIVQIDINNIEVSRKLEQLKHRESKISLNQDLIIEILLNFCNHKRNNPAQSLSFRFVTNASYTTERPAIFLDGRKGIDVWIKLYSSDEIELDNKDYISIKEHLLNRIQEKIDDNRRDEVKDQKAYSSQYDWVAFKEFVESDNNFVDFIKSFEWSVEFSDHENVAEVIKNTLLLSNLVDSQAEANFAYERLFLFVFKLLSNRGIKRLVKQQLINQIPLRDLSATDQTILESLGAIINRIDEIEKNTHLNTTKIAQLTNDLNVIVNSDTVFDYKLKSLSFLPPALIHNGTLRKRKVAYVIENFHSSHCIWFQGINGTGKTQLASLVCLEYENVRWLDLRSYGDDFEKAIALFEVFLSLISGKEILHNRQNWILEVVSSLPSNTMLVINDIPNLQAHDTFNNLLSFLINAIKEGDIRLLITSNFSIPHKHLELVGFNAIQVYQDFDFTDEEIIEYLIKNGADESVIRHIGLISALSNRNPRLVSAIVYHLKSINWGQDSTELFETLFNMEFSKEALADAQESIKRFIRDQESRELLYRLSLIRWSFNLKVVHTVSSIQKRITHPNEKFHNLLNIWIQSIDEQSYQISPLVYGIGEGNLEMEVIHDVHAALGKLILSERKLDQISASRCIISFLKAQDYNNAGIVLLELYRSGKSHAEIKILKEWGFLHYWADTSIPRKMGVILRAFIRLEQIRLRTTLGEATTSLYKEIEGLPSEEELTVSERTILHIICATRLEHINFDKFYQRIKEVIGHWKQVDDWYKEVVTVEMLWNLLWFASQYIRAEYDVERWFNLVSLIEKETQTKLEENKETQQFFAEICNQIESTVNDRDKSIEVLNVFVNKLNERKHEVLEAVIVEIIVRLEFQISPQKALAYLNESNIRFYSTEAKYLLFQAIGKSFFHEQNIEEATVWLSKAVETECTDQDTFVGTLIYGAAAISRVNSSKAVEYCELSVRLAIELTDYLELDYVKLLTELAIAYWLDSNHERCFEAFDDLIYRLFELKKDKFDSDWMSLFSLVGHSLGYIASDVTRREVPEQTGDGSEYLRPYQGIIYFNKRDLAPIYDDTKAPIMYVQLAFLSEGSNRIFRAYELSLKAFDLARRINNLQVLVMISGLCGQYAIINYKVVEALESCLLSSAITSHITGTPQEVHERLKDFNIQDIYKARPSLKWNSAESTVVTFTVIPLFIMTLTAYLENSADRVERSDQLTHAIADYKESASDGELWFQLLEVVQRILNGTITESELITKANSYGDHSRTNLQMICSLGIIFITDDGTKILTHIMNIFPLLTAMYEKTERSILKYVLIPFVKNRIIYALGMEYVGSQDDLSQILTEIDIAACSSMNSVQMMLRPVVKELDLHVSHTLNAWLFEYQSEQNKWNPLA